MAGRGALAAWAVVLSLAAVQWCVPERSASAEARRRPTQVVAVGDTQVVAVGDTGSTIRDRGTEHALRRALVRELGELGAVRVAPRSRARYVVDGAVTRMTRDTRGSRARVRCSVSLLVSEARGGRVRMMLSGSAAARGTADGALEHTAMRAAVRGALRSLHDSLARLP